MVEERINARNLPVLIVVSFMKFAPAYYYHLVAPLLENDAIKINTCQYQTY